MTTEIPIDMTYQIEYPTLAGYATPETAEYIALAGNTRTVESVLQRYDTDHQHRQQPNGQIRFEQRANHLVRLY